MEMDQHKKTHLNLKGVNSKLQLEEETHVKTRNSLRQECDEHALKKKKLEEKEQAAKDLLNQLQTKNKKVEKLESETLSLEETIRRMREEHEN